MVWRWSRDDPRKSLHKAGSNLHHPDRSESPTRQQPEWNDRNEGGLLTLRGCEYYVSAHYYRYKDGSFQLGPEFKENGEPTNSYDRRQSLYVSNHAASESARTKLAEAITNAVNGWATANPQVIAAANIEHLQNKIESAQADVDKAKEVLSKAEADLKTAEKSLWAAEQAVRQ
jgi:hypothetical protein